MTEPITKPKPIPPAIQQLVMRDLGKYGGHSTSNKYVHLLSAIDIMTSHLGWDIVEEELTKKLEYYKQLEIKTNNQNIYSHIKSWNGLQKGIKKLIPILNQIQMAYDEIKDKKMDDKAELEKRQRYKRLCKKLSHYQVGMTWLFVELMRISELQKHTIKTEAFRTQEISKYTQKPFTKETKQKRTTENI